MVVNHLELIHPLVQANRVIPLEANVDGTGTLPRLSLELFVVEAIAKTGLITQMAAEGEKYKLASSIFLFVDGKHQAICVAKFAVGVNCIEHGCKRFREVAKVESESSIAGTSLLLRCQCR